MKIRFIRMDNARAAGISGTGLGLYLCRILILQQGGRLWFTSTEGEGTTFFLTLLLIAVLQPGTGEEPAEMPSRPPLQK